MRGGRAAAGAALLAALAGCAAPRSSTEARYRELVAEYAAAGRLRTEAAPLDAPFGNRELVRNFERIAFFTEFSRDETRLEARAEPVALFRWQGPLVWRLEGDAATAADRAAIGRLTARVARLTGLEVREARGEEPATMVILVASEALRRRFVAMLDDVEAGRRMRLVRAWARDDRFPCVGQVGRVAGPRGGSRALLVVKAETMGLLRESCFHEELVQSLGLLNDDAAARPSIFNDDQEFALLTRHDEYLLRILFDPRLEPGMTAAEGMPVVARIVAEIGPDGRGGGAGVPPPPALSP